MTSAHKAQRKSAPRCSNSLHSITLLLTYGKKTIQYNLWQWIYYCKWKRCWFVLFCLGVFYLTRSLLFCKIQASERASKHPSITFPLRNFTTCWRWQWWWWWWWFFFPRPCQLWCKRCCNKYTARKQRSTTTIPYHTHMHTHILPFLI